MADDDTVDLNDINFDDFDIMYDDNGEVMLYESFCNVFARELTQVEFEYLVSRYRFVDLAKDRRAAIREPDRQQLQRYRAPTGWWVCDYGDRIMTSPGRLVYGNYSAQSKDDDDEGGGDVGVGSLTQQSLETLQSLFMLINARWDSVFVVDGYYALQRIAWMLALDNGMPVSGFEPTGDDERLRNNILFLRDNDVDTLLRPVASAVR